MLIEQTLKKIPLFSHFENEELEVIQGLLVPRSFKTGSIIFKENDEAKELFILLSGTVAITRQDEFGEIVRLAELNRNGDFFGEMSLFDGQPRSATVCALTEVETLALSRNDFFTTIKKDPTAFTKMFEKLSLRLRESNEKYFSEMSEKNRALFAMNQKLKRLDEMKSKFINLASHELKTPLNAILTAAQIIADQKSSLDPMLFSEFLGMIIRNGDKLDSLISNILLLSQLKDPEISIERKEVSAAILMDELQNEVLPFIKLREQKIEIDIEENCPMLFINEVKMHQSLVQLCYNAIKFTKDRGLIKVYVALDSDQLTFGVVDNGVGIADQEKEAILGGFYEVHDAQEHTSGQFEFMS